MKKACRKIHVARKKRLRKKKFHNNNIVNDELFVFRGDGSKKKKQKKERKPFPGQEMLVVLQGFSRRKTTHYLRA